MACRGVYFALIQHDVDRLRTASSDAKRLEIVQEEIEQAWDEEWLCQVDKAWDAIHRSLTDGSLKPRGGSAPLNLCVLGGESLYAADNYLMHLLNPTQVRDVADAIAEWDEAKLRAGYARIVERDYGVSKSEEDFQYTWDWFSEVRQFFRKSADAGRWVIFTADQ
jgi:hypothetical protein